MTTRTVISKSGAPVVDLSTWVESKNDPELSALFALHAERFNAGGEFAPLENLEMDNFYNQYLAETNQELVSA